MAENANERQILCCGPRTWSLVIGWLQTISSVIAILYLIVSCFVITGVVEQVKEQNNNQTLTAEDRETKEKALIITHAIIIASIAISVIAALIQLIAGICLIQGVKQQNVRKIKIWRVIQIVFLVFAVVVTFLSIFSAGLVGVVKDIIGILVTLFFLWVVNIHQQELEAGGFSGPEFRKA